LEGGTPIDKLLEAIEESRFAIVVLSENFADSKWCLKELVKILDCRKRKKQLVLPIFYEVEPTDIRNLKGRYGEAMAEHGKELGKDSKTVLEWTLALNDISRLKGEHFRISNFKGEHYERYVLKYLRSRYNFFRFTICMLAIKSNFMFLQIVCWQSRCFGRQKMKSLTSTQLVLTFIINI
jgi:hypothetical protein